MQYQDYYRLDLVVLHLSIINGFIPFLEIRHTVDVI